jgi:excisionase family DNA binding protein
VTEPLMKKSEVADLVNVRSITIDRWVQKGQFPRPVLVGPKSTRFRRDEVERWLKDREGGQVQGN